MARGRWIDGVWYEYMKGRSGIYCPPWQKPIRGSLLNPSHPLSQGLVFCAILNESTGLQVFDQVGRKTGDGSIGGTAPTWIATPEGIGVNCRYATTDESYFTWGDLDYCEGHDRMTFEVRAYAGSAADSSINLYPRLSTKDDIFAINFYCNGQSYITDGHANITVNGVSGSRVWTLDPAPPNVYSIAVQNSGTEAIYYCNGYESASRRSRVGSILTNTNPVLIGEDTANTHRATSDMAILAVRIWKRQLTQAELLWLYREPYCMFGGL